MILVREVKFAVATVNLVARLASNNMGISGVIKIVSVARDANTLILIVPSVLPPMKISIIIADIFTIYLGNKIDVLLIQ